MNLTINKGENNKQKILFAAILLMFSIMMLEVYDKEKDCTVFTDEVGQDILAGVLLSKLKKEQVDAGDLLMNGGE